MAKRKRTWTKKQKAAYWARRRLQNRFRYDPSLKGMRMDIFGPNRSQYRASGKAATRDQLDMRRAIGYYGEGDYKDWLKYGSRIAGAGIGAAKGFSRSGVPGALGNLASGWESGAKFSKMMGWGDYNTPSVANQIINRPPETAVTPAFVNPGDDLSGDVVLYHREFIKNVSVSGLSGQSTDFEIQTFELNPGIQETFPFLSQIANNFELYEFQGLMFQYVPTYGESGNSSNNLGKVVMATNYDPDATEFTSSVQMQNYDYSNSCKPSLGQVHGVETMSTKRATDMLYIREGTTSRDKVFTDIGKFQIATEGIPLATGSTSSIIGELWVTYKIKLSRAKLRDTLGSTLVDSFRMVADGTIVHSQITAASHNDGIVAVSPGTSNVRTLLTFQEGHILPGKIYKITSRVSKVPASGSLQGFFFNETNLEYIPMETTTGTTVDFISAGKEANETYGVALCYVKVLRPNVATSIEATWSASHLGDVFHLTVEEASPEIELMSFV